MHPGWGEGDFSVAAGTKVSGTPRDPLAGEGGEKNLSTRLETKRKLKEKKGRKSEKPEFNGAEPMVVPGWQAMVNTGFVPASGESSERISHRDSKG